MSRPEKASAIIAVILCTYIITRMIQELDFQSGSMWLESFLQDLDGILK